MEDTAMLAQINRYYQLWCDATQLYENWAKKRGITYNTVLALCTLLSNQEHCTQKMICEQWGLPKQTVNTILKDFERKGYVTFTNMPSDKRNKLISLTASGTAYAGEISSALYKLDYEAVGKMGLARMTDLNDNLALYIKHYREAEQENGGD